MGVPFLIDSVTRPEAFTTSGRSYDCVNMSRQAEGFRIVKITGPAAPAVPAATAAPVTEKK